ncbi:unnamed protein product [Leptidea sinapis]|uniref:Rhodanese domain-containing protein n=1 Tax=Leptidea sinapis TaxID=189913 RepID=A0A5E4QF21_9NEOP|nr:unnamed protein product [Leptidea sinapis]
MYYLKNYNSLSIICAILLASEISCSELANKGIEPCGLDPNYVVYYEDVVKVVNDPNILLVDVRTVEEVRKTGKIPSSINIPVQQLRETFVNMSEDEFKQRYNRTKPTFSDNIIVYCQSGRRATTAFYHMVDLGFTKVKVYLGSWSDWSRRHH